MWASDTFRLTDIWLDFSGSALGVGSSSGFGEGDGEGDREDEGEGEGDGEDEDVVDEGSSVDDLLVEDCVEVG